jgi:hypothetical protein
MLSLGLVGVGVMAALDELVFHQILAWHHFYDRSTSAVCTTAETWSSYCSRQRCSTPGTGVAAGGTT